MRTKKKLTRKLEFTAKARKAIHKRDGERCVFCTLDYEMPEDLMYCNTGLQIMHIVPRSKLGMGVEQNGALGCVYHHQLMDNGNKGKRAEMQKILEERMEHIYPGWTRESVTYSKYGTPAEESCRQQASEKGSWQQGFQFLEGVTEDE